jgi:hypothetical protein
MASGADRASADARSRRPRGNSEDRVSPPTQAAFSMVMLGSTRAGDAYPFSEYERMFRGGRTSKKRTSPRVWAAKRDHFQKIVL